MQKLTASLFFSLMFCCSVVQAQGGLPTQGDETPPPPPPWAITSPDADLKIAGSTTAITTSGTWPKNDAGWTHKYILIKLESFTETETGDTIPLNTMKLYGDVDGNWSTSVPFPSGAGIDETDWPDGTIVTVSIGQAKFVWTQVEDPVTGLVRPVQKLVRDNPKVTKEFGIVP
jgi:hypothetical protein